MSTDPTVILILSNVSTASIVALLAFAALEIRKERDKDKAAEAAADRAEADKTWALIQESREHFFAFNAQPLQQHAAIDTAPSLPALSDQSHEDEQAPAEDELRPGAWWLPLMTVPLLLARVWGYVLEWSAEQVRLIRDLASKPQPYRGRHWVVGTEHTSELPIIRRSSDNGETNAEAERIVFDAILQAHRQRTALVPAQRDGRVA